MLTIAEIHAIVPAIAPTTIRKHLAAGRTTRQAMLTFAPSRARAAGLEPITAEPEAVAGDER